MGSSERAKRKVQLWKKATVHFSLCFVVGFFTGFAPTGNPSKFSKFLSSSYAPEPEPEKIFKQPEVQNFNRSLLDRTDKGDPKTSPLVIIVTPTSKTGKLRGVLLRRMANTLKLVDQPLLWVVVERNSDDSELSEILRKTGIMYRHIVSKENFTDADIETDHLRNIALFHIEQHRLTGIVLFAELSTVFDLSLFSEIRAVEAFGVWPVAKLSPNKHKVQVEGPVCDNSDIMGWHLKETSNEGSSSPTPISSFAFNSSILWDPERWGRRSSSVPDNSQNSVEFVKKEVLEEETKLKGIPVEGCYKILVWSLHA